MLFRSDEVIEDAGIGSDWTELFRRPLPGRHLDLVIDTQRRVLTTLILRRLDCDRFISGAMDFALSSQRPPFAIRRLKRPRAYAPGQATRGPNSARHRASRVDNLLTPPNLTSNPATPLSGGLRGGIDRRTGRQPCDRAKSGRRTGAGGLRAESDSRNRAGGVPVDGRTAIRWARRAGEKPLPRRKGHRSGAGWIGL